MCADIHNAVNLLQKLRGFLQLCIILQRNLKTIAEGGRIQTGKEFGIFLLGSIILQRLFPADEYGIEP